MRKYLFTVLALSVAALGNAAFVFLPGNNPQPGQENVLFNDPTLVNDAMLVEGITNQSGSIVNFYGAGEDLHTNGGQARIEGLDGTLTALSIAPTAGSFSSVILNINVRQAGTVSFGINGTPGLFAFAVGNGQNFMTIVANGGDVINELSFTSTVDVQDVRQVRVGFHNVVPGPAALVPFALGALSTLRKRRRA